MQIYEEVEYSNVALRFDWNQIQRLMNALVETKLPVTYKESNKFLILSVKTMFGMQRLLFNKQGRIYQLRNRHYSIKDKRLADVLQHFIKEMKGHAVLKLLTNDQLVVHNIRYGEPVRITQITGSQKKILFEKECTVTMDEVLEAFQRTDAEQRIPSLKAEMDQELTRLFQAILSGDDKQIAASKELLDCLRLEMVVLEYNPYKGGH
jgi:hypothetical protein